jgi:hypothetical protein
VPSTVSAARRRLSEWREWLLTRFATCSLPNRASIWGSFHTSALALISTGTVSRRQKPKATSAIAVTQKVQLVQSKNMQLLCSIFPASEPAGTLKDWQLGLRSVNAGSYAAPRQRSISERQYQPPRSSPAAIGSLAARRLGRGQRRYQRFEGETLVVLFVLLRPEHMRSKERHP